MKLADEDAHSQQNLSPQLRLSGCYVDNVLPNTASNKIE